MAIITKVHIVEFTAGGNAIHVYYKNKNRYRNDRVRMFHELPKSAEKFIETAQNKNTYTCSIYTATDYTN